MDKKLYRSSSDLLIAGVCGGVAKYFNIDSNIVRLIFVIFGLFGAGLFVYILLWVVLPIEQGESNLNNDSDKKIFEMNNKDNVFELKNSFKNNRTLAFVLIFIGFLFLLNNFFHIFAIFQYLDFSRIWPVLLIILGFVLIFKNKNK